MLIFYWILFWFPVWWYLSLAWKIHCKFSLLDMLFHFPTLSEFRNKKIYCSLVENKKIIFTFVYAFKIIMYLDNSGKLFLFRAIPTLYTCIFTVISYEWKASWTSACLSTVTTPERKSALLVGFQSFQHQFQPATLYRLLWSHWKPSNLINFTPACEFSSPSNFCFPFF